MSDEYKCSICGKRFHYRASRDKHKKTCGIQKLSSHVQEKDKQDLDKLFKMNEALRRNSYDVKKAKKSKQMSLRNRKV